MNKICNKINGISLVESLIALTLFLFILFSVLLFLDSLIVKQVNLTKSIEKNQEISDDIFTFEVTGQIDHSKYNVEFIDNDEDNYQVIIHPISNKSSTSKDAILSAMKPFAKIRFKECNGTICSFDASGSLVDKDIGSSYSYHFSDDNSDETTYSADTPIVHDFKFQTTSGYTVTLKLTDGYGFSSEDSIEAIMKKN